MTLESLKQKVLEGKQINKEEAMFLVNVPLESLSAAADELRQFFCGNKFDLCTIVNGKSGKCSEDCKYCAQSAFYKTKVESYPLLETEELVRQAQYNWERGVPRYSIVTSGKRLNRSEVEQVCESIREIKKRTGISVCVSFGLLEEAEFRNSKKPEQFVYIIIWNLLQNILLKSVPHIPRKKK